MLISIIRDVGSDDYKILDTEDNTVEAISEEHASKVLALGIDILGLSLSDGEVIMRSAADSLRNVYITFEKSKAFVCHCNGKLHMLKGTTYYELSNVYRYYIDCVRDGALVLTAYKNSIDNYYILIADKGIDIRGEEYNVYNNVSEVDFRRAITLS